MKPPSFRDSDEFKRGRNGEKIVARYLQDEGKLVIPCYDYAGDTHNKAPRMEGTLQSYILPDLDVLDPNTGERVWVEVKTKANPIEYRKAKQLRHGIDLWPYQQYCEVQRISGNAVWLYIFEECSQEILRATLDGLDQFKQVYEGMVYWPRDAFEFFRKLPPAPPARKTA